MATIIKLICKNCKREFFVNKGKEKDSCSNECKCELRKKNDEKYYIIKECEFCNVLFKSKKKEKKKYCSYSCAGKAKKEISREKRICKECNCEFIERKKHNKLFCSEKCRLSWQSKPENIELRIIKSKEALLDIYGVDSIFKIDDVQNKIKEKNKNHMNLGLIKSQEIIRIKREKKLIERFFRIGYNIIEFKENSNLLVKHPDGHLFENNRKFLVNRLNHHVELSTILLPVSSSKSTLEILTTQFLDTLNIEYITNNRKIVKGYEYDIVIEKFKLCIELNGLYWHSENYLNKTYHINKLKKCNTEGYSLLNFFEDEIIEKFNIVKSIILKKINLLKNIINVIECNVNEISKEECNEFINLNDLKKYNNSTIMIGLYYKNKLVSVLTIKKLKNNTFKILCFCESTEMLVIGGINKLFDFFINKYKPNKILVYINKRYEDEYLYVNLGFIRTKNILPNYWYVLNKERKERTYKHKFKLPKIYDCGSEEYEYNKKKLP